MSHCFKWSSQLKRSLEQYEYHGPQTDLRELVDANDTIMHHEYFDLNGIRYYVPRVVTEVVVDVERDEKLLMIPRFEVTNICVAQVDTLSAARHIGSSCALNFANSTTPGGRYRSNGRAQEEDLCRHLPQLYASLREVEYPILPNTALVTPNVLMVRDVGTYALCESQGEVTIISAAMPCGTADRRPKGGWMGSEWAADVTQRIRAVLFAAKRSGKPNLVLGAFGCGAFGNPAAAVAAIFREQLCTAEFRGAFAVVVFAIIDPVGTGNLKPFQRELRNIVDM